MNPKRIELYNECKPYLIFNYELCVDELKEDAPEEIKEKWNKYNEMDDDMFIISNDKTKSTQK